VLDQILVVVSVTAVVMVIPGPDMILVLGTTFVRGRAAGLQTAMGILLGNLVHITYCMLGIGLLITRSIVAFSVLKYAAAARRSGCSLSTRSIDRSSVQPSRDPRRS
jgi:threonine/homoserine/homoserine lactone efflux protein